MTAATHSTAKKIHVSTTSSGIPPKICIPLAMAASTIQRPAFSQLCTVSKTIHGVHDNTAIYAAHSIEESITPLKTAAMPANVAANDSKPQCRASKYIPNPPHNRWSTTTKLSDHGSGKKIASNVGGY